MLQPHAVQVFCTRVEQVSVEEIIITYYLKIIDSKFLQNERKVWPMYELDVQFNCNFKMWEINMTCDIDLRVTDLNHKMDVHLQANTFKPPLSWLKGA